MDESRGTARGGAAGLLGEVAGFVALGLCVVLGFLAGGPLAVFVVVAAGVAALTWRVSVASRPARPLGGRSARGVGARVTGAGVRVRGSGVLVGHQGDADIVHDEGRQGEGVEDLVEAEPPR